MHQNISRVCCPTCRIPDSSFQESKIIKLQQQQQQQQNPNNNNPANNNSNNNNVELAVAKLREQITKLQKEKADSWQSYKI